MQNKKLLIETLQDVKRRYGDIDSALSKLTSNNSKWDRVEDGDSYYMITNGTCGFSFKSTTEEENVGDVINYASGNYCTDLETIEYYAFLFNFILKVNRWADRHNEELISWSDTNTRKYCIFYNTTTKSLEIDFVRDAIVSQLAYFETHELAKECLELFKNDWVKVFTSNPNTI